MEMKEDLHKKEMGHGEHQMEMSSHAMPGSHGGMGQRPGMQGAHRHMLDDFRRRFIVSMVLTVPILLLSPSFQSFFGFSFVFSGSNLILLVLSTAVYAYGGYPFLKGFVQEIRSRLPGMMTLIAVAITIAYGFSAAIVLGLVSGDPFFWELATLIDIMLLGHWVEMRSVLGASRALEELGSRISICDLKGDGVCESLDHRYI